MSGSRRELLVATGPFSPFSRLYPSLRIHSVRLLRLLAPTFRSITWFETVQDDSDPPAVAVSVHWRPVRVPVYSPRLFSAAVLTYLRVQVSLAWQVLAQRDTEVIIF